MSNNSIDYALYKDDYEICIDKFWTVDKNSYKIVENDTEERYKDIDIECIPYLRYPRTKDGITIPRIIHNVFKIF